ncbi:MAG TPA: hypothetical protein VGJ01_02500 [Pseudolabrys sp.]
MTTKKNHRADAADAALIPACKKFTATILKDNKPQTSEFDTLADAQLAAAKLNASANNGRKALVYAITDDGRAILVRALKEAAPATTKAEPKPAPAKVAKPAKAPAKKANSLAKKAAPPKREGSKVEIVIAMLTGRKPITRKDIAEATEWPSVNIKAICVRKGMKLKKNADGTLSASAPK